MADNLYSRYASGDSNTEGPLRFVDIGSIYYAVSILAKADGTLVDAATSANQTTMIGHLDGVEGLLTTIDEDTGGIATSVASIDGKITACNTGAVVVSSSALPSGAATSAKQDTQTTHLATLAGAVSGTEVQVDVLTMPTVTIADGGGSVTVDGSVSITGSVAVTGTFWQATQPVSLASVPSHDVTNVGTFAVQAAQSGTWTVQPGNTANTTAWLVTGTGGTFPVTDSGGSLTVDNAGTFAVQVDGTALTRLTDIETNTDSCAVVGNGAAATAQRVTIANDSTGILAGVTTVTTVTTCSTVTNLSQLGGQAIAMGTGTRSAGTQRVTIATDDVVPITDNSGSLTVDMPAVTTGGASIFRSIDLDESEEEIKGSAGTLYGGIVLNLATGVRYLKLYNATAANVTVGTTTPVMTIPIPTQAATANGAGFTIPIPACGVAFDTAITVAATTGVADSDTGAPGANEVVVNLFYK